MEGCDATRGAERAEGLVGVVRRLTAEEYEAVAQRVGTYRPESYRTMIESLVARGLLRFAGARGGTTLVARTRLGKLAMDCYRASSVSVEGML